VLVELPVLLANFVVIEQHELVVHVTRMPGG
jgi:hypothetical protein